jgi:ppGpp synthetase/RelA/SpoT-type nucleotidyltranferase
MTDVPALCAAAFHYSSLVAVRERELDITGEDTCSVEESECLQNAGSDAKYLCALAGSGVENFGTHAVKIALDAARLKSMETLATTVVRKNGKLGPLRPVDAQNLRSLLLTVNEEGDWRALAIRSAACLYRLEGLEAYRTMMSTAGGPKKTRSVTPEESRASQEALHIYAPLAARLGMFHLKQELEDAAFRTLYPRSHAKVSALCGGENTNSVGEGMKSILSDITNQMKRLVQEDCTFMENIENVSVTARVKEPYSVWRKMLKISRESGSKNARDLSILDIHDAVATRVVFSARKLTSDESDATTQRREKELCYHLFDLCTRNWPSMRESHFKDYVKNPKENGYQSLHFSSHKRWRGTEWPFEVQIRSRDMHRVAEYGVAAHWSYKRHDIDGTGDITAATSRTHRLDRTSEAYLKSVQEWRTKQASRSYVDNSLSPAVLEEPASHLEEEIRRQRKRERDETLAPYLEALSGDQTDMTRENVFVFVSVQPPREDMEDDMSSSPQSEGTVLSLPRGSRVLDAIRVTEKWSNTLESSGHLYDGRSGFVALRNGLRTSSMGTELLSSGDVVSILPSNDLISTPQRM